MKLSYRQGASSVNAHNCISSKSSNCLVSQDNYSGPCPSDGDAGGKARITCPPQVVNGLDFLKVSLWLEWRASDFFDELESLKEYAQSGESQTVPFHVPGGFDWNLHRTGTSRYNFRLTSGDVTLLLNRRKSEGVVPTARLEIGSLSCCSPGYLYLYDRLISWLRLLGAKVVKECISEVHLKADFLDVDINSLGIDDEDRWVSRVHKFNIHRDRRRLSGISLGKGNLMLRIYDKVLELKTASHKQEVFAESWGFFIYNQQPVTRVEFQLRRDVLRDFETRIETIVDLTNALQSLWNYCSESWAKFCASKVNRNHNQSKALIDHFWARVCNIDWNSSHQIRREKPTQNKSLDLIRTNMRGMAMSASAFNNPPPDDLPSIIRIAQKYIEQDLTLFFETDQHAFEKKMRTKKNEIFVNI